MDEYGYGLWELGGKRKQKKLNKWRRSKRPV